MLKFMQEEDLIEPLRAFHEAGGALYGTCAGAILLAEKVTKPAQDSLSLMDIDVERNAYGRQIDSHESFEPCPELGDQPLPMGFHSGTGHLSQRSRSAHARATPRATSSRPPRTNLGEHVPSRAFDRHPCPPILPRRTLQESGHLVFYHPILWSVRL